MPLKDEHVPELHGKMPNVTSETVEKTIVFGVPKAPPGTKTARNGRTNRPQNRTEKVPNVTSGTLLELKT